MSKYDKAYFDKLERRREDPDYDPPPAPAAPEPRGPMSWFQVIILLFAIVGFLAVLNWIVRLGGG